MVFYVQWQFCTSLRPSLLSSSRKTYSFLFLPPFPFSSLASYYINLREM